VSAAEPARAAGHEESLFASREGAVIPSAHARGPWDPAALHGGAPAALIASTFERRAAADGLVVGRLGFEFLRPVPCAPLQVAETVLRNGRRVRELGAELSAEGRVICRASGLCVTPVPGGLPVPDGVDAAAQAGAAMPGPDEAAPVVFTLDETPGEDSFAASAMEMRWLDDPRAAGPARVWMRLRVPLLDGAPATPLALAAGVADFGNGVSRVLPFDDYLFINADLSLHLHRPPRGEWVGLDARTLFAPGGAGLSESVLHDADGPFGRAFQTLVVQARGAAA
jgi:hypothetical protein